MLQPGPCSCQVAVGICGLGGPRWGLPRAVCSLVSWSTQDPHVSPRRFGVAFPSVLFLLVLFSCNLLVGKNQAPCAGTSHHLGQTCPSVLRSLEARAASGRGQSVQWEVGRAAGLSAGPGTVTLCLGGSHRHCRLILSGRWPHELGFSRGDRGRRRRAAPLPPGPGPLSAGAGHGHPAARPRLCEDLCELPVGT